jgi:hypothetical protein
MIMRVKRGIHERREKREKKDSQVKKTFIAMGFAFVFSFLCFIISTGFGLVILTSMHHLDN